MFEIFNNSEFFVSSPYIEVTRCPVCNISYNDFKHTSKLGCSQCYKTFISPLSDLLKQVHGNAVHTGKIPGNLRAELTKKQMINDLKNKLQVAVRNENYEEAARLHKEILSLEKE